MNDIYRRQVALLIRVMPLVFKIKDFAVHGGTAINLFHRDLPRYSVDIDITYVPLEDRETSLKNINKHLASLKTAIEKAVPGIRVTHKPDVWKLQCVKDGTTIKIEVNGTKRGLLGDIEKHNYARKPRMSSVWPVLPISCHGASCSVARLRRLSVVSIREIYSTVEA